MGSVLLTPCLGLSVCLTTWRRVIFLPSWHMACHCPSRSLLLSFSSHLPLLFYVAERRPAGGRGPDIKKTGKKREKRQTYVANLSLSHLLWTSVCALCVHFTVNVCVSRWDFDGTVSNASHTATAGWQQGAVLPPPPPPHPSPPLSCCPAQPSSHTHTLQLWVPLRTVPLITIVAE